MRTQRKIINLYKDAQVVPMKQVFSIAGEADLDYCWYYLSEELQDKSEALHSFISLFYEFSNIELLKMPQHFFELIFEFSDTHYYFTIWNEHFVAHFIDFISSKDIDFCADEKRLTVAIQRLKETSSDKERHKEHQILASIDSDKHATANIPPYTFIVQEDLEELFGLSDEMMSIMNSVHKHHFIDELFVKFRSCLSLFSLTLRNYTQVKSVANTITDFSALVNTNKARMMTLSKDEIELIDGFITGLDRWLHTLFIHGGAELSFMDNSLQADYQTISMLLVPQEQSCALDEEIDLDDIFNF